MKRKRLIPMLSALMLGALTLGSYSTQKQPVIDKPKEPIVYKEKVNRNRAEKRKHKQYIKERRKRLGCRKGGKH